MRSFCFVISWLLISAGCATTDNFAPIDNCVLSSATPGGFSCVKAETGEVYQLKWDDSHDLVCFHEAQFKSHEEVCHE